MNRKSGSLETILLLVILTIVVVVAILPQIIRAFSTPAMNACVNNLRQLDGAEQQWALENRKTTNDVPTMQEIRPYLKNTIKCPQGGVYTLGPAGTAPKCSVGGTHLLPE